MSDGSLARFTDTFSMRGVRAAKLLFIKEDFECIPDHRVGIGRLTVPGDPVGYEGEAEWALIFPKPIADYAGLSDRDLLKTRVTVVGLVEGKALSLLGKADVTDWAAGCVGNNVLTGLNGYDAVLGNLASIKSGELKLEAIFKDHEGRMLTPSHGGRLRREVDFAECEVKEAVHPDKLLLWLRTLGRLAEDEAALRNIRVLNLSALGQNCAAVNDKRYFVPSLSRALLAGLATCWRFPPHGMDRFRDLTRSATVVTLTRNQDALPPQGGIIELCFQCPNGRSKAELRVLPSGALAGRE